MNLAQVRTFVTVVEQGSFSEAARILGLSQPAVTMQVQSLESELGATLLERRYRAVDLTEAGRMFLPYARGMLDELEAARVELDGLAGRVTGRLQIWASTTPGQYVLPRLLGPFLRENPEVGFTLRVADSKDVVRAVESGDAHLGMTGVEMPGVRAVFERLGSDELVMVCPPEDPLASRKDVSLAGLTEADFIMREEGSGTRAVFERVLREAGVDPGELRVVTELGTSEAIVTAVEGGMGLGVVSRWMAEKALKLGTVAETAAIGFPVVRPFFVVIPKTRLTRAAEAFLEHLRRELATRG